MTQKIQGRISQIIDTHHNSIKKNFCIFLEIKEGTLFSMFRKNTNPSFELVSKILEKHRDINPYWLILGEGDMQNPLPSDELPVLKKKLAEMQKEMDYLKKINELLESKKG